MQESQVDAIVVDLGNTRIKIAGFKSDEIKWLKVFGSPEEASDLLLSCSSIHSVLASVADKKIENQIIHTLSPNLIVRSTTKLPISLERYETPNSLGVDRIANVVAAAQFIKSDVGLVIDIGSCLKFDVVAKEGLYLGGSIAPGMKMRFRAMNEFTGKLPLVEPLETKFIGRSTTSCMQSGVMNGMTEEIKGFIGRYKQEFEHLTIFLTGGDAKRFDKALKNSIFVDENLTLKGLYLILKHNA